VSGPSRPARCTYGLVNSLKDLCERGYVPEGEIVLRSMRVTPVHKLYLLNGHRPIIGYYRLIECELRLGEDTIQI
jgi:hypothetical protein